MNPVTGHLANGVETAATVLNIPILAEWAQDWILAHGLDKDVAFAVRLCVEEAATNIVLYAYDDMHGPRTLAVSASRTREGAQILITDRGAPFDVAAAPDPGQEGDIHSATSGGRGIRLIRRFSDGIAYARVGDQNCLTLTFKAKTSAPGR